MKLSPLSLALALSPGLTGLAHAETGKLLLTGGVSSIDGAAGGGLTPWAVIGSNATEGEIGATAHLSRANTQDYGLTTWGAAVGLRDRVELSIARQDFNAGAALALNGIAPFGVQPGQHIRMDVVGIKLRVAGEEVADTLLNLLDMIQTEEREVVTMFYGNNMSERLANEITDLVREKFPNQAVDLYHGGQPHYYFVVGVE